MNYELWVTDTNGKLKLYFREEIPVDRHWQMLQVIGRLGGVESQPYDEYISQNMVERFLGRLGRTELALLIGRSEPERLIRVVVQSS